MITTVTFSPSILDDIKTTWPLPWRLDLRDDMKLRYSAILGELLDIRLYDNLESLELPFLPYWSPQCRSGQLTSTGWIWLTREL
jgi:hypothetical protein